MSVTQLTNGTAATNGSTRVVMLGTGTPRPDPNRSGPATAIIVNDTPYLIDFGPGVIRRATAAFESGVTALGYAGNNIKTVFLTHLHSDHTVGYPDLIFTSWVMGRNEAARGLWPERDQSHDRARPQGLGSGHRGAIQRQQSAQSRPAAR